MKQFDTRFWIYVFNAACGAGVAGVEALGPYIGTTNVKLVQAALGVCLASLNAARAYIDQHQSRKNTPNEK